MYKYRFKSRECQTSVFPYPASTLNEKMTSYKVNEGFDGVHESNPRGERGYGGDPGRDKEGCFVRTTTGFCMVFLVMASIAGVAVVVYFAAGDRNINCNCQSNNAAGSSGSAGQCPPTPTTMKPAPCPNCTCPPPITMYTTPQQTTTSTVLPSTTTTVSPEPSNARLPLNLLPIHYELDLGIDIYTANPADFSKFGRVTIQFLCQNSTRTITLHIKDLKVTQGSILLHKGDGKTAGPMVTNHTEDKRREFLHIHLDTELIAGETYFVQMNYTGPLRKGLFGLYYSSYKRDGKDVYLAVTQLQPTFARNAFPCFDEPSFKATFTVTIRRRPQNGYISLSNMPLVSTQPSDDGYVADTFNTSVKMSTYLLAFIVCDFTYKENITNSGILFRTYARQENIAYSNFSVQVGSELMDSFEEYFQIDYSLPKYDMISIPDFGAGAMENWGLVTYRTVYIIYNSAVTTTRQQQSIAVIIAHENAHMWFGNIISPAWWDDIWLNEGFATFLQYLGVDRVRPDWKIMSNFGVWVQQPVLSSDSFTSTRAMYQQAEFPDEILGLFDRIAYSKSACVIRMMWYFMGAEVFRKGLKGYIRAHEYGSVTHQELWADLQKEAEANNVTINIPEVMDPWMKQKHYPAVTMSRDGNVIQVTQEPFVLGQEQLPDLSWEIPITYATQENPDFYKDRSDIVWVKKGEAGKVIGDGGTGWVIGNLQQFGYYRVNYDDRNWAALIQQLKDNHTVIHTSNRAQIIDDIWAFVSVKKANISQALRVFDYLDEESEYPPWYTALGRLERLGQYVGARTEYKNFKAMMQSKLNRVFSRVGLVPKEGESMNERILRATVSRLSCKYGMPACMTSAVDEYNKWKQSPDTHVISPDSKYPVLCAGIQQGDEDDWNMLFERYGNSSAAEQSVIRSALACSTEPWILNRYLEYSLDPTRIRPQDSSSVIVEVSINPIGVFLAFQFVSSNWKTIIVTLDQFALQQIVPDVTRSFSTEFERQQVEALKAAHPPEAPKLTSFDSALAVIQSNIGWVNENYPAIKAWLQNY